MKIIKSTNFCIGGIIVLFLGSFQASSAWANTWRKILITITVDKSVNDVVRASVRNSKDTKDIVYKDIYSGQTDYLATSDEVSYIELKSISATGKKQCFGKYIWGTDTSKTSPYTRLKHGDSVKVYKHYKLNPATATCG